MGMGLSLARLWSVYHNNADYRKIRPREILEWASNLEEKKVIQ